MLSVAVLVVLCLALFACDATNGEPGAIIFTYTFADGKEGWLGGFTDLPVDYEEDIYELDFAHTDLPEEAGAGKALMLSGINRSDDLFMYVRRQITSDQLKPNTTYRIVFVVQFATDAPAGAVGVGGPPGEAVWVKVGAASTEPVPVAVEEHMGMTYYQLSVDKGSQNDDGEHALRIGDVAKEDNDEFGVYELKTLSNQDSPLEVTTDDEGSLWIFVGTDSGFEGRTTLYYHQIGVTIEAIE